MAFCAVVAIIVLEAGRIVQDVVSIDVFGGGDGILCHRCDLYARGGPGRTMRGCDHHKQTRRWQRRPLLLF